MAGNARLNTPRFILIASVFVACFFGWVFIEIAEEVWIEKEFFPFDNAVSAWMKDGQAPLARTLFESLTVLGSTTWLVVLTLAAVGFLFYRHRRLQAWVLLSGFIATTATTHIIKHLSARVRPDSSLHEVTMAFPSGHAAISLFVYGMLGYLLSRQVLRHTHSLRIMIGSMALAGLIGFSRLYLNVHWLSDVLGGFALAAAYLCVCVGYLETQRKWDIKSHHESI